MFLRNSRCPLFIIARRLSLSRSYKPNLPSSFTNINIYTLTSANLRLSVLILYNIIAVHLHEKLYADLHPINLLSKDNSQVFGKNVYIPIRA